MLTIRLPTACASVATKCQYQWGRRGTVHQGPINKHEQVSSDGYQMSLVGGRAWGSHISHVWRGAGAVYSEALCIMNG